MFPLPILAKDALAHVSFDYAARLGHIKRGRAVFASISFDNRCIAPAAGPVIAAECGDDDGIGQARQRPHKTAAVVDRYCVPPVIGEEVDFPRFRGHLTTGPTQSGNGVQVPRTRPPYPPEFRRETIELVRSSGEPLAQIANDLGCTPDAAQLGQAG